MSGASEACAVLAGMLFFILHLSLLAAVIVGWIVFLVAAWRGMKAHESIARSLERIAQK